MLSWMIFKRIFQGYFTVWLSRFCLAFSWAFLFPAHASAWLYYHDDFPMSRCFFLSGKLFHDCDNDRNKSYSFFIITLFTSECFRRQNQRFKNTVLSRTQELSFSTSKSKSDKSPLRKQSGEGGIWTLAPLLTTCTLSRGVSSTSWVLLQKPE